MKIFYDCEFIEGTQSTLFGKSKPTIDMISIGLVAEDNRTYYAISKDFNLKEAWNRYDVTTEQVFGDARNIYPEGIKRKVYWIRENVLRPVFKELNHNETNGLFFNKNTNFTCKNLKRLLNKYGKSNKQISEEIKDFVSNKELLNTRVDFEFGCTREIRSSFEGRMKCVEHNWGKPKFYGYYSDYDHVALCWLFGKMIDLPNGFPMYCIDLKQELERLNETLGYNCDEKGNSYKLQEHPDYPTQTNDHHSLSDALWAKELYNFLNNL